MADVPYASDWIFDLFIYICMIVQWDAEDTKLCKGREEGRGEGGQSGSRNTHFEMKVVFDPCGAEWEDKNNTTLSFT